MNGMESTFTVCPHCDGSGAVPMSQVMSRVTDPETSRAAGAKYESDPRRFSMRSRQARLLKALSLLPMTAQEAAFVVVGKDAGTSAIEGCRRRVSDLHRAGFVVDAGERRNNEGSSDPSIVWRLTLMGLFALEQLEETGWSA